MRTDKNRQRGAHRLRRAAAALALAPLLGVAACDFDRPNPNAPTEQQVLTDTEGLIALATGMQAQFANSMLVFVRAPALATDEWGARSAALAADQSLIIGGAALDRGFGVVSGPYAAGYRVIRSANDVIASVPTLPLGPGFQAGMIALARLHKAMALGMLVQQFEQIPIDANVQGAPLQPRAVVLEEILSQLAQARQTLQQPGLDLSGFNTRVLGHATAPALNLPNTIDAMIARYSLMAGRYPDAIAAAERVNLNVIPELRFPDPANNPIWNYHFGLNYVAARQSFVDEAEPGDRRPAYWVNVEGAPPATAFPNIPLRPVRVYAGRNDPVPVSLPGEMLLIRAEAHARLNQLPQARTLVNQVRTRCQPAPANQPAACLPALTEAQLPDQAAILRQVAYERRYELYMQALRWEDMRRLADVIDRQPSVMWLPIPLQECQANPAVQCPGV
jgi:starch-binding outer membrane protein, SusD/RagB family